MALRPLRRWVSYAACLWAVVFAAPHVWWAAGVAAGFPGGEASHHSFVSNPWLYLYLLIVIALCAVAVWLPLRLLHRGDGGGRHRLLRGAAWLASAALALRGVAGLVVDGASDPIWWPTFLAGGVLFGAVAWLNRGVGGPTVRAS